MDRPALKLDHGALMRATQMAQSQVNATIRRARSVEGDLERECRLLEQECACCFYLRRGGLAGQAFTYQPCALCHEVQTFSSTNTDATCRPCAKQNQLCKHCGGDIEMRASRKDWPTPKPSSGA